MNELNIGFTREVKPQPGALFIGDELPRKYRAQVFDPTRHSFNPIAGISERQAQELAEVIYTIYPEGSSTLTVRKGKWELAPELLKAESLDKVEGGEEVEGVMGDLLFDPLVKNCLCGKREFQFDETRVMFARLNRKEIGDRSALIIGLFLIGHFKGQLIIPDLGFYGRDAHVSLIREERLIAGLNSLDELPTKLRKAVLLIKDKKGSGTTYEDAVTLATYARLLPGTDGFSGFVGRTMA